MPSSVRRPRRAVRRLPLAGAAHAQAAQSKREQTLKYRKALYQVHRLQFRPDGRDGAGQGPVRRGRVRQARGARRDDAPLLVESFPRRHRRACRNSELKPEMWANRADFDAKMKDLVDRSATLATVAKAATSRKSKAAFFDAANTCKACHDKYKTD